MANHRVVIFQIYLILLELHSQSMKFIHFEESGRTSKIAYYLQIIRECNGDRQIAVVSAGDNCARYIVEAFLSGNNFIATFITFDTTILRDLSKASRPKS